MSIQGTGSHSPHQTSSPLPKSTCTLGQGFRVNTHQTPEHGGKPETPLGDGRGCGECRPSPRGAYGSHCIASRLLPRRQGRTDVDQQVRKAAFPCSVYVRSRLRRTAHTLSSTSHGRRQVLTVTSYSLTDSVCVYGNGPPFPGVLPL